MKTKKGSGQHHGGEHHHEEDRSPPEAEARKTEADEAARNNLPGDADGGDDHRVGQRGAEIHFLFAQGYRVVGPPNVGPRIGRPDEVPGLHGLFGFERAIEDEIERHEKRQRAEKQQDVDGERRWNPRGAPDALRPSARCGSGSIGISQVSENRCFGSRHSH
jgi:hypothetical protein